MNPEEYNSLKNALSKFQKTVQHIQESLLIETIASKPLVEYEQGAVPDDIFAKYPDFDCIPLYKIEDGVKIRSGALLRTEGNDYEECDFGEVPLISSKTPIYTFIERLSFEYKKNHNKLPNKFISWLVLTDTEVDSVVAVSDLMLPPVSVLVSALIQYLESLLTFYIQTEIPTEEWMKNIEPGKANNIKGRQKADKKKKQDLNLIYYTTLWDKIDILEKTSKIPKSIVDLSKKIPGLRNDVAHVRPLKPEELYTKFHQICEAIDFFEERIFSSEHPA